MTVLDTGATRGAQREDLRTRGQFWTPDWVADAMVTYIAGGSNRSLYDVGVGGGAFAAAYERLGLQRRGVKYSGIEKYPDALEVARSKGISPKNLDAVVTGDFLDVEALPGNAGIVANPPYIRHHRLDAVTKARLKHRARDIAGFELDGRAGLHVHIFMHALSLLGVNSRLSFIVPADIAEGVFAKKLWRWVATHFSIDGVATFAPDATPFPKVDTNAVVLFISRNAPRQIVPWARVGSAGADLCEWVTGDFTSQSTSQLEVSRRDLDELLATGLTRHSRLTQSEYRLGTFARTMRGVATGDNDFFLMTEDQRIERKLPRWAFKRAIARTRDLQAEVLTMEHLDELNRLGRPTYLLSLTGREATEYPSELQSYLDEGVAAGLSERALIKQRKPWYKMEVRASPDFLFSYLGRRSCRFIENRVDVVPLTGFLCVYIHAEFKEHRNAIAMAINDPRVLEGLSYVGKSYGGGAVKVEPRGLEQLQIPMDVVREFGIDQIPLQKKLAG